jgi:3-methylfumaryl-CoA hydratase
MKRRPAIVEFHDIVFREAPKDVDVSPPRVRAGAKPLATPRSAGCRAALPIISALTFNAHRIHYDRKYVTGSMGTLAWWSRSADRATLLLDLLRGEAAGRDGAKNTSFRCGAPAFRHQCVRRLRESPAEDGRSVRLWAKDHEGSLAMDATAEIGLTGVSDETAIGFTLWPP